MIIIKYKELLLLSNMNNTTYISNNYITFTSHYIMIAVIKLGLSIFFSLIISIERELHSHPGGACTHMLVGLGSCLYTMISIHLRDKYPVPTADPARICAQIVSGMGFLGSATIFKSNNYVKGINTAANLWISAAISMAIGADLWELGLVTSGFTIIILFINNRYKRYRYGKKKKKDTINDNIDSDCDFKLESIISNDETSDYNNIELGSLSRSPANAPYGNETEHKDD